MTLDNHGQERERNSHNSPLNEHFEIPIDLRQFISKVLLRKISVSIQSKQSKEIVLFTSFIRHLSLIEIDHQWLCA